mmetsp:Transcript_22024/g.42790  ORF Transcript_22024/g.42790 Transcript_22024/m.42790 type:complete len:232 (+) Transcript_22024:165-860(+)
MRALGVSDGCHGGRGRLHGGFEVVCTPCCNHTLRVVVRGICVVHDRLALCVGDVAADGVQYRVARARIPLAGPARWVQPDVSLSLYDPRELVATPSRLHMLRDAASQALERVDYGALRAAAGRCDDATLLGGLAWLPVVLPVDVGPNIPQRRPPYGTCVLGGAFWALVEVVVVRLGDDPCDCLPFPRDSDESRHELKPAFGELPGAVQRVDPDANLVGGYQRVPRCGPLAV